MASGQGNLAGSVTFTLYENSTCTDDPTKTEPSWTVDIVTGDTDSTPGGLTSTVRSSNSTYYTSSQAVSWTVEYNSTNIHHNDINNVCDKSSWLLGNNFTG